MTGVAIDMVIADSLGAWGERIFDTERIEVTNYERGLNEAAYTVRGFIFWMKTRSISLRLSSRVIPNRYG
ncbi:MAG: hypothetical protein LBT14_06640 [Treponema sp.]|jgi:hypothetical protein|nr:hypothetical protein [Treponema sp.]